MSTIYVVTETTFDQDASGTTRTAHVATSLEEAEAFVAGYLAAIDTSELEPESYELKIKETDK